MWSVGEMLRRTDCLQAYHPLMSIPCINDYRHTSKVLLTEVFCNMHAFVVAKLHAIVLLLCIYVMEVSNKLCNNYCFFAIMPSSNISHEHSFSHQNEGCSFMYMHLSMVLTSFFYYLSSTFSVLHINYIAVSVPYPLHAI